MHTLDWPQAIARARAHAPFLAQSLNKLPDLAALLAAGEAEAALVWAKQAGESAMETGVALRRERTALALALAIGDLAGAFPLLRITAELSDLADRAMDRAIAYSILRYTPDAEPAGFLALALGKHGARELNYSSDIDPILLFDPDLLPRRSRDDPGEAAQRVARSVVETLSHVTDEGYVFRVDLRLRPASEVSPLAISLGAATIHYESQALTWERAAFVRARACAGDRAAGEEFLATIRPFVWRKSLDFSAIAEIGQLNAQIRDYHGKVSRPGPGFDVKRGRGGIREVEFYAQAHQLIHGGRNPALRVRGTRASLDALAAAGIIGAEDAQILGQAYDRLRTIEHRLQMVSDRQTHTLPDDAVALDSVAQLDGLKNGAALIGELEAITETVALRFDTLVGMEGGESAEPSRSPISESQLAKLGFGDAEHIAKRMAGWRQGKLRSLRSDAALAAYEAIEQQAMAALAAAPEPDRAFLRWEQLLTHLPSAVNLFRLLEARPGLLEQLARILALAPPLADALARRPDLLDPLIDASAFALPGDVPSLITAMSDYEPGADYQAVLDKVRRKVGELRFILGVQLIEGLSDPLDIAAALARVAEAAIAVLTEATIAEFAANHGRIAGSQPVILGLGRLGGQAMTHTSDLDLVYLFTGETGEESDGARSLSTTHYYNRLAQRITAALTVPTAEGALYEVDTRLRPSGTQGLLAVNFASFDAYQQTSAWTWEHMALCRARTVFGAAEASAQLDEIIKRVLTTARDPEQLHSDVLEMRGDISQHKAPLGPLDIKLLRGGLVDLEFLIHTVQLQTGRGLEPDLGLALRALCTEGHLPPDLIPAYQTMARGLVAARLLAPDGDYPPPAARQVLAKASGCSDWLGLLADLASARRAVAQAWQGVFGAGLEDALFPIGLNPKCEKIIQSEIKP